MGAVADLFVLLQLLFLYQGDLNHVRTARWAVHEPGYLLTLPPADLIRPESAN